MKAWPSCAAVAGRSGHAGHRREEDRRVSDVAGHRPGGVLLGRDRDDARPAHQPERRLDADVRVGARGTDDRAVGLRADSGNCEVGRHGDAGAGARAARIAVEDVGHVGLAADSAPAARRRSGPEVRPLGEVGLADDQRAGGLEPRDDECVGRCAAGERPEPAVVAMPVVSMLSLTMIGMPSSGR